ncbi:hypothetical protein ACT453_41815, partial [Bacillus sp. D-CC]
LKFTCSINTIEPLSLKTLATPVSGPAVRLSLVHPAFGQALEYEVQIVPNQPGGLYSVYGLTAETVSILSSQRVVQ